MSMFNNLNNTITEKNCDWCGTKFSFTTPKSQYLFKKYYKEGVRYFCSESCKRKYEEEHRKLAEKRRIERRNAKKRANGVD